MDEEQRVRRSYESLRRIVRSYEQERHERMYNEKMSRIQAENDRARLDREMDLEQSDNG